MVELRRIAKASRLNLALGGMGWLGLIGMTRPVDFAAFIDRSGFDGVIAFDTALIGAFLAFSWLTYRFGAQLLRNSRRFHWDPETRAVSGTVMAEFALVLPIVLLLLGTVIQIALIANAALVVRYAAFVAARSAMVSFQADMGRDLLSSPGASLTSMFQMPPFPEFVDRERPEHAATMVLASISPRATENDPTGVFMSEVLKANGDVWDSGNFAQRVTYARAATTVMTIKDRMQEKHGAAGGVFAAWHDSLSPLIPEPEHVLQPARQRVSGTDNAYVLPSPPPLDSLIPDAIPITLTVPLPSEATAVLGVVGVDPPSITIDIPLAGPKQLMAPLLSQMDAGINVMRTGSGSAIRAFARSPANIDILAPKEVEITLVYLFRLSIPSLIQLAPGVTEPAPLGNGRAFKFEHPEYFSVRLQSTGGRRTLLGILPKVIDIKGTLGTLWDADSSDDDDVSAEFKTVDNTPLYWRPREKQEEDEDEKKKKEGDAKKKADQDEKNKNAKKDAEESEKKKKEAEEKKKEEEAKKDP